MSVSGFVVDDLKAYPMLFQQRLQMATDAGFLDQFAELASIGEVQVARKLVPGERLSMDNTYAREVLLYCSADFLTVGNRRDSIGRHWFLQFCTRRSRENGKAREKKTRKGRGGEYRTRKTK